MGKRERIIDGELHTVESIIEQYTPMVVKESRRFFKGDYHYWEDLKQIGFMGLVDAFERFEEDKGMKFSTFAFRYIRGRMRILHRDSGLIHIPAEVKGVSWRIKSQGLQDLPKSEIAKTLGVTERMVESCEIYDNVIKVSSFDIPSEEGSPLHDAMLYHQDLSHISISHYLLEMNKRELQIISKLMDGDSYSEIGRDLEVSSARIGQIVKGIRVKITTQMEMEYM